MTVKPVRQTTSGTSTLYISHTPWSPNKTQTPPLYGKPKQLVDVTQANGGNIQSEFIDKQLAKESHLMMGIFKEKSLRTHHQ